ncbi:MAG: restriction endonuclease [Bacteroidetes bacterium]|jgi:type II restriction enzyme|nr:restriction endonuclease [Bacteroidota bacterium]
MDNILEKAILSCNNGIISFSKFITANDTGANGAHQAGFHIHKNAWSLFFNKPGEKGNNKDKFVRIKWQDDFETDSRFIYYGVGTRNEYRLTRFGRGFPFLNEWNIGDLLVISKKDEYYYEGYVLTSDEDIEDFFDAFGVSSTETNKILPKSDELAVEDKLFFLFESFLNRLEEYFPPTNVLAKAARDIFIKTYHLTNTSVLNKPDKEVINWIATEYELFKFIENKRYTDIIQTPFKSVDELIKTANTILNRRKSRAGRSLEHHLAEIFEIWKISYSSQVNTEEKKKPDFIFPDIDTYYKENAGSEKLVFLGAKTTCKDRWRQILGEADKIPEKHLFTLQQGISGNQIQEMITSNVTLVVPEPYISSFPKIYHDKIWTLKRFVQYVAEKQK